MLGLERNVDARPPDDTIDAPQVRTCLDDTFSDGALDANTWEAVEADGIAISTDSKLVFTYTAGTVMAGAQAYVRTKQTFDLRGGELEAFLEVRPIVGTETRLAITRDNMQLYEMRILPPGVNNVRLFNHSMFVNDIPLEGNFLRIKVADEIVFGTGATPSSYSAYSTPLGEPPVGLKIQVTAVATVAAVQTSITWPRIAVKCR